MADLSAPKPAYRKVVAALAESEERYRILVESVRQYAIFMLDPAGIILTWNRGMQELLGYNRDEIVGQLWSRAVQRGQCFQERIGSGEKVRRKHR